MASLRYFSILHDVHFVNDRLIYSEKDDKANNKPRKYKPSNTSSIVEWFG